MAARLDLRRIPYIRAVDRPIKDTMMTKRLLLTTAAALLGGCASVVNDTTQVIKVETKTPFGELVSGARCSLSNDLGSVTMVSGESVQVRRSNKELVIVCKDPENPEARATAISRMNVWMWGNAMAGGFGAIVDHRRGTAYTYPSWVQLIFGKSIVFDRSDEKEGHPTIGIEPPASAASAAGAAR